MTLPLHWHICDKLFVGVSVVPSALWSIQVTPRTQVRIFYSTRSGLSHRNRRVGVLFLWLCAVCTHPHPHTTPPPNTRTHARRHKQHPHPHPLPPNHPHSHRHTHTHSYTHKQTNKQTNKHTQTNIPTDPALGRTWIGTSVRTTQAFASKMIKFWNKK